MDFTQIATQLFSDDISVRLAALAALEQHSREVALPQDILHGLLRCLGHERKAAQAVYLARLADSDPMVRLSGLSCLGKLRLVSAPARTTLLRLLEADPDLGVRRATAVALGQLGESTPLVIEALRKAAQADDVG